MEKFVMALDQGTTSSRCILFDRRGRPRATAQTEFRQIFPRPGWIEHDPMEILSSQLRVARQALREAGIGPESIAAIGIANQRETTVVWERSTGRPIYNAIVWQCRRTAQMIDKLRADGLAGRVREVTGLVPDAYFSGSKIAWILDNVEGARERARRGELLFGTVETWLIWNLTGGAVHATDRTNASRTMLFDIRRLRWDGELLDYFGIPLSMMPEVRPSGCIFGYTDIFGAPAPIAGAAGDQQAALFGQCCFDKGEVKNTYGTGCFMLMNTGGEAVRSENGLITTVCAGGEEDLSYALEGSVFVAGAAVQWLRDSLGLVDSAARTGEICESVPDTGGVYLVPAFTGLGAPYWNQYARGTVVGITRGTGREHIIRAVLESLAYEVKDLLDAMSRDSGARPQALKVDGGASANDFLMRFQADILDADILRPGCVETTAQGAAYLAGLAVGFWSGKDELRSIWELERRFICSMPRERADELLRGWRRAVRCALSWAEDDK